MSEDGKYKGNPFPIASSTDKSSSLTVLPGEQSVFDGETGLQTGKIIFLNELTPQIRNIITRINTNKKMISFLRIRIKYRPP
jgi:hypothetical protein